MEQRLIELETRIAFQDNLIQALNDVLARQQLDMLQLARELDALRSEVRALVPPAPTGAIHEPPPHY